MEVLRVSRMELHMTIAKLMAQRGTCERLKVGCVITREGRIVSTGYNGAPAGIPHCTEVGCEVVDGHCITTAHAEAGAIAFAARNGVSLEGTTLFVTASPCLSCAKLIINAGVSRVVYEDPYGNDYEKAMALLKKAGVDVHRYGVNPNGPSKP